MNLGTSQNRQSPESDLCEREDVQVVPCRDPLDQREQRRDDAPLASLSTPPGTTSANWHD